MKTFPFVAAAGIAASLLATACVAERTDKMMDRERRAELRQDSDRASFDFRRSENRQIEQLISGWPEQQRMTVNRLVDKYGPPSESTENTLVWRRNGQWEKSVISREAADHSFPAPHKDYLEQFVKYEVPIDKFDDLARFDGSVYPDRTRGLLSARCDREEFNILALNLAHEIVTNERSVEEARDFLAKTAMEFKQDGKRSPYLERLRFNTGQGDTADADRPAGR